MCSEKLNVILNTFNAFRNVLQLLINSKLSSKCTNAACETAVRNSCHDGQWRHNFSVLHEVAQHSWNLSGVQV